MTDSQASTSKALSQNELRLGGYLMIERDLTHKLYDAASIERASEEYGRLIAAHDEVNATLVWLLAMSVIENS